MDAAIANNPGQRFALRNGPDRELAHRSVSPCRPEGKLFTLNVGVTVRGDRRMSKELDDVTRALAGLQVAVRRIKQNADVETAMTQVVDCLVMALGEIEVRLDLLERGRLAELY